MGQLDVCRLLAAAVVDRECRRHLVDGKLEKVHSKKNDPRKLILYQCRYHY